MTKARENSDYTGLVADITAGDTAARAGRKNLILNGSMQISQRGDYTSATAISSSSFYLDRHKIAAVNVTGTVQHTDITINGVSKKALRVAATSSATGYIGSHRKTELADIQVGETYTLSCWVRSNNANTRFRVNSIGGVNVDGPAFTNDGNWEKVSHTFDSTSTIVDPEFYVITYNSGSVAVTTGDYFEFTELQLELGSVATDFEHRSYGEELALCQRYYYLHVSGVNKQIASAAYYTSTAAYGHVSFPVTMRSIPSLEASSGTSHFTMYANSTGRTSNSLAAQGGTESQINVYLTTSASTAGHGGFLYSKSSSTRVAFDAEL